VPFGTSPEEVAEAFATRFINCGGINVYGVFAKEVTADFAIRKDCAGGLDLNQRPKVPMKYL
jgi:hypothetical protein